MEVRLIDKDSKSPHHAGRVVGTAIKTISSKVRTTHSVFDRDHPAPLSHLIKRALKLESEIHHAEIVRTDSGVVEDFRGQSAPGNPAPKSINHAGQSGKIGVMSLFQTAAYPDPSSESQLNAGEAEHSTSLKADARTVLEGSPATCPRNARSQDNQNAEQAGHKLFLLKSSLTTFHPRHSAPRSTEIQNAGGSEKASPPGLWSENQLLTRSPCAPQSNTSMEVIGGYDKFLSPFRRFLSYLKRHTLAEQGLVWEYHGTTRVAVRRRKA